ncbi:hypothetical protein [Aridibaculum aurantiacum]|uniref:hypothetical protein n=1 Tax=Aridibaculum aurantiacum TaxID=2810307 RepID=UPI001A95D1FC|nr:hypothetical protein [Aridibaculum aurantiacum]
MKLVLMAHNVGRIGDGLVFCVPSARTTVDLLFNAESMKQKPKRTFSRNQRRLANSRRLIHLPAQLLAIRMLVAVNRKA